MTTFDDLFRFDAGLLEEVKIDIDISDHLGGCFRVGYCDRIMPFPHRFNSVG